MSFVFEFISWQPAELQKNFQHGNLHDQLLILTLHLDQADVQLDQFGNQFFPILTIQLIEMISSTSVAIYLKYGIAIAFLNHFMF